MTTFAETQNALEKCLADLARLGFGRAPNALFSEYLAALVAEELIDASLAQRIAVLYHRSRYGALDPEDSELQEIVTALEALTTRLAALPDAARFALNERIRGRLTTALSGGNHRLAGGGTPLAETPQVPAVSPAREGGVSWDDVRSGATGLPSQGEEASEPEAIPEKARRRWPRLGKIPLEIAIVTAVGIFFAGYLSRGVFDNRRRGFNRPRRDFVRADSVFEHQRLWVGNLEQRIDRQIKLKQNDEARLALELLASYKPLNPYELNWLAWEYLTSKDAAVKNPSRGLAVAMKAVSQSRDPSIVDTAAEGYFQAGDVDKAVELEKEALQRLSHIRGIAALSENRRDLERQLKKFEAGRKPAPTASPPQSRHTIPAPAATAPSAQQTTDRGHK